MNQTRSNFFHPLLKCPCLRLLFEYYYIDILILQIYYILTTIAIVTSNGLLLYKLLKKRLKTRADKMFIILSCSDIGVGLSSVPMSSLPLFIKNFDALCMLSPILRFFFYIPYSWSVITTVALDRVLIITKGYWYKKYVTMKHLYGLTTFSLLANLIMAITIAMDGELLDGLSFAMRYTQTVGEVFFIIVTIVTYMYLVYFVRSKSREIANQRHGGIKIDKELLMTITYTYICLLIFTFPYFAERVAHFVLPTVNPLMSKNMKFWGKILVYSNSYANAFIILYKSR